MSEYTEQWRLAAGMCATAPDPYRFVAPSIPSRDARLLMAGVLRCLPGGPAVPRLRQGDPLPGCVGRGVVPDDGNRTAGEPDHRRRDSGSRR